MHVTANMQTIYWRNLPVINILFGCDCLDVVFVCYFAGNFGEVVDVELVMDRAVSLYKFSCNAKICMFPLL